MLERIELFNQALAYTRMFHRAHTIIRIANNGQMEPVQGYHWTLEMEELAKTKL